MSKTKDKENGRPPVLAGKAEQASFLEAYRGTMGNVALACEKIGISRQTYYNYRNQDETFALACKEVEERTTDFMESALIKAAKEGNVDAIKFYLARKGKDRGWGSESPAVAVQVNGDVKLDLTAIGGDDE